MSVSFDALLQQEDESPCAFLSTVRAMPASPNRLTSRNPATGAVIAKVVLCGEDDYRHIIEESRRSFGPWRSLPAARRGEQLRRIADAVAARRDELAALLTAEAGMLTVEAQFEVDHVIDSARNAATMADNLDARMIPLDPAGSGDFLRRHPIGPVGAITHFSAPLSCWARTGLVAAACGNPVIWKPSSLVPLSAIALHRLVVGAMEPEFASVLTLFIPEHGRILDRFVSGSDLALLSFSGSLATAQEVAGKNVCSRARLMLDLPGNNAAIIDESADLDATLPEILSGALGMTGQRPWGLRRLIVHERIHKEVFDRLKALYGKLRIGNPAHPDSSLGPVIGPRVANIFRKILTAVQAEGGDVLCGGQVLEGTGHFLTPALVRAENHWEGVQRKTLLPILYALTFRDFEEAIALHNAVPVMTAGSLFTTLPEHAAAFLGRSGSVAPFSSINAHPGTGSPSLPFGVQSVTPDRWRYFLAEQTGVIRWNGPSFLEPPKRRRGRPPGKAGAKAAS